MVTREDIEKKEHMFLGQYAQKADTSKGREKQEEKCIIRTDFMRDRDRIIHSKAFRRLMHKTQVFIAPEKDHYRTRLTHTIEVGQIARTIGRALSLNEDLIEAIALTGLDSWFLITMDCKVDAGNELTQTRMLRLG